ncbi:MAG: YbhB/YbcL family Raf kinase inhibitor-like protein [Nanoarchaeota archaeon]
MEKTLKMRCPFFSNMEEIPEKYTCYGDNVNPPLLISGVPREAQTLLLIVDDPDTPNGEIFTHWFVYDIPVTTKKIPENSVPAGAKTGPNTLGKAEYIGPCPPSGTHRYFFKLYALKTYIELAEDLTKEDVITLIEDLIVDHCEFVGLCKHKEFK